MREKLIDLLLAKSEGIIVACNIIATVNENLLSSYIVKEFFLNCIEAFKEDQVRTTKELIAQFEDVARGDRPVYGDRRNCFLLACSNRTSAINNKRKFSTIMDIGVLNEFLIDDTVLAAGHSTFLTNTDPTDPMLENAIDQLNGKNNIFKSGAYLGGSPDMPIFWIAPSEFLATQRNNHDNNELGNSIRDLLGLIHHAEEVPFVEIQIPGEQLKNLTARPTFAEACTNIRFRVLPDSRRARLRTGWGCTVDLNRFANNDIIIDGVSERVVKQIQFNETLCVKMKFAGITQTKRGETVNDDNVAFAKRICSAKEPAIIKKTLLDILL